MFNIRLKNLFLILFLLISLTVTYGCSSKPPEGTMKIIIVTLDVPSCGNPKNIFGLNYEKFQITNEFHKKVNNEEYYYIEVNYKYTFYFRNCLPFTEEKNQGRFSFIKRGKEWYGYNGWKGVN
jgi:hypothetical protein